MAGFKLGLEDVTVAKTKISFIDGKKGVLEYRGYNINDLAENSNFEEVIFLLWYGKLPDKKELNNFSRRLRSERKIDSGVLKILKTCSKNINAMDALRTAVSFLAHCDKDLNDNSKEANIRKGIRMAAKFPTIIAAFHRIKTNKKVIQPNPGLSSGANFLYMLKGKTPSKIEAKAMESDFILTAEHELNASTFSARVTISSLSDLHSAICSAIGTLKGVLHGGARAEVYKMLGEIKSPEKVENHIMSLLSKGQKIMGFGHRVYRTYDPRALIFRDVAKKLAINYNDMRWYNIAVKIDETVIKELVEKKGKPIYPNVDFYTGPVYRYLKIPPELTTSIFAISRISGWVAHCLEQYGDNRIIRPLAEYIGPHYQKYIQIEKR